jgi:hypothetical protein
MGLGCTGGQVTPIILRRSEPSPSSEMPTSLHYGDDLMNCQPQRMVKPHKVMLSKVLLLVEELGLGR